MTGQGGEVAFVRNVPIPMRDGVRLAADLHMPAGEGPFPLILEYLPYRKDDQSPHGGYHHYFARHGYIGCRVDIRGTGASEGVSTDEYLPREQEDGYDVVEWLAAQPWCDGRVAMFGFSYGGFVCYQVAMRQPPHLTAIVPCYATDDRYTDDCHYRGGLFGHYYDVAAYGTMMVAMNALPPYPEYAGPDWARVWEERLERNTPYLLRWIEQQTDGPYWRPGSLRGRYDRVLCPTFIVEGWHDGYATPQLRTYAHLKSRVPARLLMGPWDHTPPDAAVPGPCIDYLHEVVRWLDHHVKGLDTGVGGEPPVRAYMQRYDAPDPARRHASGEWRAEEGWPPEGSEERAFSLAGDGRLAAGAGDGDGAGETPDEDGACDEYAYHPAVGITGGLWSAGVPFGLPADQRPDEAYSLVYTSAPLTGEVAVLGWPRAVLHVSSTAEVMAFRAALCDVAPDGTSALVAKGILNATRRESLTDPTPIVPGQVYELDIQIDCTGWIFEPGHRIRLAIASADYPNLWPTPLPGVNRVYRGRGRPSRLILPVVPPRSRLAEPTFRPSTAAQHAYGGRAETPPWRVTWDVLGNRVGVTMSMSRRRQVTPGLEAEDASEMRSYVSLRDPADVGITGRCTMRRITPDADIGVTARVQTRSTAGAFHLIIDLNVTLDGVGHAARRWLASVPRRLL